MSIQRTFETLYVTCVLEDAIYLKPASHRVTPRRIDFVNAVYDIFQQHGNRPMYYRTNTGRFYEVEQRMGLFKDLRPTNDGVKKAA